MTTPQPHREQMEYTPSIRPNYSWCAIRILRADQQKRRIVKIADEQLRTWNNWPRLVVAEHPNGFLWPNADGDEYASELASKADVFSHEITLLFSEAVHHLRAALDTCVSVATWKKTGELSRDTDFPLWQSIGNWSPNSRRIKHLSLEQQRWVRAVQPFNEGCEWSWWLSELSNSDKHRSPIIIEPALVYDAPIPEGASLGDQVTIQPLRFDLPIADYEVADGSQGSIDARVLLQAMTVGVVEVVNKFLVEDDQPPMTTTLAHDEEA